MRALLVACALACACRQLAGIEEAVVVDGDLDDDGVDEELDNCPDDPNSDQNDEDNDDLGDPCDPCPLSTDNRDVDGDGVGDACDPHPAADGDKMIAFYGFATAPEGAGIYGTWNFVNGSALTTGTSQLAALTGTGPLTVTTRIYVDDYIASSAFAGITMNVNGTDGANCMLATLPSQHGLLLDLPGMTYLEQRDVPSGTSFVLTLQRYTNAYKCTLDSTVMEEADTTTVTKGNAGLSVSGAAARFAFVMIVGR